MPATWPVWRFEFVESSGDPVAMAFEAERAEIPLAAAGALSVDRATRTAIVRAPDRPTPQAWVHPYLSPVAMVAADWAGRLGFHAGSFLDTYGRVWGLIGDRGRGKSTAATWLVARGRTVFADDLLITDGDVAFGGPRCIDLRESAAKFFGLGTPLGVVGERERWRLDLQALECPSAPLGGFVALEWTGNGRIELNPVHTAERQARIAAARALLVRQQHPLAWLRVLAKPMLTLRRPKEWTAQDDAFHTLLEVVDREQPLDNVP